MNCIFGLSCGLKENGKCTNKVACIYQQLEPKKKNYEEIGREIGQIVDKKNKQYGDAINNTETILKALYPNGIKPEQYNDASVIVRVIDKLYRISKGDQGEESAWKDLAGYGILRSIKEETK